MFGWVFFFFGGGGISLETEEASDGTVLATDSTVFCGKKSAWSEAGAADSTVFCGKKSTWSEAGATGSTVFCGKRATSLVTKASYGQHCVWWEEVNLVGS